MQVEDRNGPPGQHAKDVFVDPASDRHPGARARIGRDGTGRI